MKWILSLLLVGTIAKGQLTTQKIDVLFGNKNETNFIKNPDCDKNTLGITEVGSGTIARGVSPANNRSDGINGKSFCSFDATASADILTFETEDLAGGLLGGNCEVSFRYAFGNGLYKAYAENAQGVKSAEVQLTGGTDGTFAKGPVTLTVPCGGTSGFLGTADFVAPTLKIESTSASATTIYIGQVYSGAVTSIGQFSSISDWQAYTPTFTNFGTATSVDFRYRIVGDSIEVSGSFTTGTVLGGEARISLPLNFITTKLGSSNKVVGSIYQNGVPAAASEFNVLAVDGIGYVTFGEQSSNNGLTNRLGTTFAGSQGTSLFFQVPIAGLSSNTSAAAANQTDYGWTAYVPTFSNFGTVTNTDCKHRRKAEELEVECKFTVGTTGAAEARVSFPPGLTGVTLAQGIKVAGFWVRGASDAQKGGVVLMESGTTYFVFSDANVFGSGTTNALTKANASGMTSSGAVTFKASVQIAGWAENQRAPTLNGSVTSNSLGAERIERISFGGAGFGTNCTASPCTINSQSGTWVSSVTRNGTGDYLINFVSGVFSARPVCTCTGTINGSNRAYCGLGAAASTTGVSFFSYSVASPSTVADGELHVVCMGPR
jgi:hypothetical protein